MPKGGQSILLPIEPSRNLSPSLAPTILRRAGGRGSLPFYRLAPTILYSWLGSIGRGPLDDSLRNMGGPYNSI